MGTKAVLKIESFSFFRQFSFHDNRVVQSSHYCTSLVYSGIQFFVLPSVTRKCNPSTSRYLNFSTCFSVAPFTCNTHWSQCFLKDEVPQFWPCLFSFRRCCMHLQSYLLRAGGQILWKKAEPNHQRKADDWFLQFPIVAHSSAWLHLSIQFM